MKLLFLLTSVYLIPSFIYITSTNSLGGQPLVCEWKHINGKSGYKCNNDLFTDDEGELWRTVTSNGYSTLQKNEPEDVMFRNWPIDIAEIIRKFYEDINQYRQIHHVLELKKDPNLEQNAQQLANQLAQQNSQSSETWHDGESDVYVPKNDIYKMVDKWYSQHYKYNYNDPEKNDVSQTGDFSQMVWSSSQRIGCGVSNNGTSYYGVCIYEPAGNKPNMYKHNVKQEYATVDLTFSLQG
uniref:CAP domain-containing protein (inferred by orthology to a human protein) n=1 Tax=Strongyloides venezuelensis TaxID=75913 RepID=A0A0K0F593_STRVS